MFDRLFSIDNSEIFAHGPRVTIVRGQERRTHNANEHRMKALRRIFGKWVTEVFMGTCPNV
jgi:hypothetical protein